MTIINFKALGKISGILATSAMLILPNVTVSNAEKGDITFGGSSLLTSCVTEGGPWEDNGTTTTCTSSLTGDKTECDNNKAGEADECATTEAHLTNRLSKPELNVGTRAIQPDTNTTVGKRVKPLGNKLINRNVNQK